jgi:hypothetical protein
MVTITITIHDFIVGTYELSMYIPTYVNSLTWYLLPLLSFPCESDQRKPSLPIPDTCGNSCRRSIHQTPPLPNAAKQALSGPRGNNLTLPSSSYTCSLAIVWCKCEVAKARQVLGRLAGIVLPV